MAELATNVRRLGGTARGATYEEAKSLRASRKEGSMEAIRIRQDHPGSDDGGSYIPVAVKKTVAYIDKQGSFGDTKITRRE